MQFTTLNITCERLLPLIRDFPDFKWPAPIQTNPSQRNPYIRCDYHRDHEHETNRCRSLKFIVERLIKVGHLRRHVREVDRGAASMPIADRITASVIAPSESRPTINYILGGPFDDQYQSKHQQKNLFRAAMVKARVNTVHKVGSREEIKPIDVPISFLPINPNRVIVPRYDALVLTLGINGFDVHGVLVDPGSAIDLLQLPVFNQMKLSSRMLNSVGRILPSFNGATTTTLGDITLPLQPGPVTQ